MNDKRRQRLQVEDAQGNVLALGIYYDEDNVSLTWRRSVGFTQEQHHSISKMFGVEPGATCVRILEE